MLGAITASLWTLRHKLNCSLPAEIAYIGSKEEVDPVAIAAMNATLGPVYGLDLSAVSYPAHHNPAGQAVLERPGHKIQKKPWEAKAWALYNSRFKQVLMADSDTYPLINPEELFNGPHMTLHGNLHWGDIAYGRWGSQAVQDAMKALGISNASLGLLAGTQPMPGMAESDHVLLDRVRHADVLEHLWWITTHSDVIYNILWGDKDTYMLAFAAAGKAASYAQMPIPPAAALSGKSGEFHRLRAMVQHDHYGRQAWVHNTLNKHKNWAQGPPAPYALVTGPMPEWVGTRLSNHPNIFAMNATRLVLLQVEQPGAAAKGLQACPQNVWSQFMQLQALGIALLPQPELMTACEEELSQLLQHDAATTSSRNGGEALAAGSLEQLLQQQAAQQQLAPAVQWASVLAGQPAVDELVHALSAADNTPAGVADLEREGLSKWLAAAEPPAMLQYLNWHLMAAKKAPAVCASAGPARAANADGAMPVMQLRQAGGVQDFGGAGRSKKFEMPAAWSALELAQAVWLPEAVRWIQGSELMRKHV
uniref:Nucleotide-diphospho-sugar transferase domain-containing protein n=1 Tax=Tetradesmus obliquus TaxID=3088 RepID=A0A383W675_TETOB|eukprot:jgi/Sobl393_1/4461/SZX72629.1